MANNLRYVKNLEEPYTLIRAGYVPFGGYIEEVKFENGYGASVLYRDGQLEVMVIGRDNKAAYNTPITSDVVRVNFLMLADLLTKIARLP